MSPLIENVTYEFVDGDGNENLIVADQVNQNNEDLVTAIRAITGENFHGGDGIKAEDLSAVLRSMLGVTDTTVKSRDKCINAGPETFTQAVYGFATTPDVVEDIVVPEDAKLCIDFQAIMKQSVSAAARAAIFIGEDQLKFAGLGDAAPSVEMAEAQLSGSVAFANKYGKVSSCDTGLVGQFVTGTEYTGDVGTGMVHGGVQKITTGIDDFYTAKAGICRIDVDPGTYDIGIKFKSSSGSITVKDRRLRVWVEAFD